MSPIGTDFQQNFFQLFNVPSRFQTDINLLEQNYRALQAQVHPDKFAHLSESERRVSMQWATRVNEGYQTLRKPLDRARYLLSLHGVETQEETNTAMPIDFLMQQMEWREAIEEAQQAKDVVQLDVLLSKLRNDVKELQKSLEINIDIQQDFIAAAGIVRKLKFIEKLAEQIDSALDELDN
ncbi:MAG: Fe-S protein assembly co-chaperone HscB [Gallionellaceae bacterium]